MAKSRKSTVRGIAEPRLRPSAMAVTALSAVFGTMILYNIFLGQTPPDGVANLVQQVNGSTRVSVEAPGKQSRTVTLKYDELVEDVQRELLATGHFQGLVDGVNGPRTKMAVELYQRENQLDVTGDVSQQLLNHIRYTKTLSQAAKFTGSVAPTEDPPVREPALDNLLVEAPAAEPAVAPAPLPVKKQAAAPKPGPKKDKSLVKLQERLAALGYEPGSRSGVLDEGTVAAILKFEMDNDITMDGKPSKALFSALRQLELKQAAQ